MKNQALFSSKDKSKKIKCRLLQFLFGPLRVKCVTGFVFCDCAALVSLKCRKSATAKIPLINH